MSENARSVNELEELAQTLLQAGVRDIERKYFGEAQAHFLGASAAANLAMLQIAKV